MSFHNARCIRGDHPYKPVESHPGHTQRGEFTHAEHVFTDSPGHWRQRLQVERQTSFSSRAAAGAARVCWSGSPAGLQL